MTLHTVAVQLPNEVSLPVKVAYLWVETYVHVQLVCFLVEEVCFHVERACMVVEALFLTLVEDP
jgi:hypothetical protein